MTGEITRDELKVMQEKFADAVMRLKGQISDEQAKYKRFKRFFERKMQWLRAIYRFQSETEIYWRFWCTVFICIRITGWRLT